MPRQWADVVFNAVDGWTDCGAYTARFPCHEPSGLAPECMLTAWLVDHGIPRSAFGAGTELRELGIVRNYWKRQPSLVYCNLHRLSECVGLAKSAIRDASRGGGRSAPPSGNRRAFGFGTRATKASRVGPLGGPSAEQATGANAARQHQEWRA